MKIIHITFNPLFLGGGERLIDTWVSNSKHENILYSPKGGLQFQNPAFKTFENEEDLKQIIKNFSPTDVVVAHDMVIVSKPYMANIKRLIWYVHGAFAFGIDVSEHIKPLFVISNYLPQQKHVSWQNMVVKPVHLGIDCKKYTPSTFKKNGRIIVGIVGRVSEEKCPLFFFDFVYKFNREHPNHNFEFVYYGRGNEKAKFYKDFVRRATYTRRFTYMGFVPMEQVNTIYQKFDCLLVPSLTESGSFAILEAQASGLTVFALNRDGIPFHTTSKAKLCFNYDEIFARLANFTREEAEVSAPIIRAETVKKFNQSNWLRSVEALAKKAASI